MRWKQKVFVHSDQERMQQFWKVQKHFPKKVYRTVIPRNVKLSEAPSFGKPVIYYDKSSRGAEAYEHLAEEMLTRHGIKDITPKPVKKKLLGGIKV